MSQWCREEPDRLLFGNGIVELVFEPTTGRWLSLTDLSTGNKLMSGGDIQAPATLKVNGVTTSTRERSHWWSVVDAETVGIRAVCTGYDCVEQNDLVTLTLHTHEGDWQIDHIVTLEKQRSRFCRGVHLIYTGQDEALLRGLTWRLPPMDLGPTKDVYVNAPCFPTPAHQPLSAVSMGDYWGRIHDKSDSNGGPGWKPIYVSLDNPTSGVTLGAWSYNETEPTLMRMRRADQGTLVEFEVMVCDRFSNGHELTWEGQWVELVHGSWREALGNLQCWYDEIGLSVPDDMPDWAQSPHIYELFIGDSGHRPGKYPGFESLIADLPRIKDLGFDTVEVMPHMDFPSYSVVDYYDADLHYGSAKGLKELTAQAHEMGMRVLLDIILHGVIDKEAIAAMQNTGGHGWLGAGSLPERHPYRLEHPEWFAETEFGTPAATYTWSFDHANKGYQDFMIGVFAHYVREYDVDGFRVDALTWNLFPNWARELPYRASASIYASAGMMDRVREAIHAIKPDTVLYSETTGPLYTRCCDLGYNYDMQWLFSGLVPPTSLRGFAYSFSSPTQRIKAADLGSWLEQRRLSKPAGAITVHHLDSHDTNEWAGLMQYRREAFGPVAARALFALCCALDGGIMMYQGAEDEDVEWYRRILNLRAQTPALSAGCCDYSGVKANQTSVFAPLRVSGAQAVLPVLQLEDRAVEVELRMPLASLPVQAAAYEAVDLLTGEAVSDVSADGDALTLQLRMASYEVQFLEIGPACPGET